MQKETKIKQKLTCELMNMYESKMTSVIRLTVNDVNMNVAELNVVEMKDVVMMTSDMTVT